MIRSIFAVAAGLVVTVVLVMTLTYLLTMWFGIPPGVPLPGLYLALNLLGSAVAGMVGGATAVRLAPHTPHGHVVALAILILLLSLPTIFTPPAPGQPGWYGIVVSILGPVAVALGGFLAARRRTETGVQPSP